MSFNDWKNQLEYEEKCPICLSESTYFLSCAECGIEGAFKVE